MIGTFSTNYASAQYTGELTSEELAAACERLGIEPEKCSEQAILSNSCLGSNEACGRAEPAENPNINLIPMYVGIAGAFAAGIIYVKKTGRLKTKTS